MKKSTILDIFYGIKGSAETMELPKEYKAYFEKVCEASNRLLEKLSPELLILHNEHVDALEHSWSEQIAFYFVEGFKLGLQIGIECTDN